MAPVGHTASHQVHQPQFPVSMKAITFPTRTNDLQEHTVMQRPHPLHLSWSITGISDMLFNSIQNHLKSRGTYLYVTFVSLNHPCPFFQGFLVCNHYAVMLQPDYLLILQFFERPAYHLPRSSGHSCHLLLCQPGLSRT
jgi:hypothetical protein